MASLTIEHIATLAGVSRSTVSRVVNDHPAVSPAVRARVRRVIEERGYTPHAAARSLAGSCTNVICLLNVRSAASTFSDRFMPPLVQGISEGCDDEHYLLLVSMVKTESATSLYRRLLRGHHCDGIIMLASDVDAGIFPVLLEDGTPYILIGCHPRFPELNSINVENEEGARKAVAHLIALGHRRIATITGRPDTSPGGERLSGYSLALRAAALPVEPELVVKGDLTMRSGYAAMRHLLTLQERPTAVFAADDAMAAGALRAIQEAKLAVPDDIAIVGFDDASVATLTHPQLTTVRQPVHDVGAEAAHMLIAQLRGREKTPIQKLLPVELVVRQSCGAQPQQ